MVIFKFYIKFVCKFIRQLNNLFLKNHLPLIDLITQIRKISQQNLPVDTSFIPYDILVFLYKAHANAQTINLKEFFLLFKHSEMGVRYHLKRLVSDGWITLVENPGDHRSKLVVVSPKFIEQMEKTLSEISLYTEQRALLSSE